ncbi:MAG: hypothetical protein WCX22_08405 [Methanoregula sp.]
MYPGRPYYFCKTNRRDNVCPVGLSTTYDELEPKPELPFRSSMEESIKYFHEHHETDRWNLQDRTDSYLLYYQLNTLQFRYFELAMALSRTKQHKKSHYAWAKHDAYNTVIHDLFPYRDGGGKRLSDEYRKVQKELAELKGDNE